MASCTTNASRLAQLEAKLTYVYAYIGMLRRQPLIVIAWDIKHTFNRFMRLALLRLGVPEDIAD